MPVETPLRRATVRAAGALAEVSGGDGPNGPSGGGSYGDLIIGGANNVPGNTNDPSYVFPQGYNGNDGLVVVQFHVAGPNLPAVLTAVGFSGNGSYLTGLNASNLSSGTIPLAVENPAVVTEQRSRRHSIRRVQRQRRGFHESERH